MRKMVKLKHDVARGFYVDLPCCRMVEGSFRPLVAGKIQADDVLPATVATPAQLAALLALNPTVEVDIPDEDCDCQAGTVDPNKIRERYPQGWGKRGVPDV